jgi:hypothetical protein
VFEQHTRTFGDFVTEYGTVQGWWGSAPYFTVLYNYVPGRFTFQVAGAQWLPDGYSGGYNPTAYFTPHGVEVGGETHNKADQMPGGTTNYAAHWNSHLYYAGAWQAGWLTTTVSPAAAVPEIGIDPPAGSLAYYDGREFYIWDKDCPS